MKKNTISIISLLSILLLLSVAVVYAHGNSEEINSNNEIIKYGDYMDLMHEEMTESFTVPDKIIADKIHSSCLSG